MSLFGRRSDRKRVTGGSAGRALVFDVRNPSIRVIALVGAIALMAAGASALQLATAAPATAAPTPFDPNAPLVWLAQGSPTQLQQSAQANGQVSFSDVGAPSSIVYNAIGYRKSDSYIYGITRPQSTQPGNPVAPMAHFIERIASDGSLQKMGEIPAAQDADADGLIAGTFGEGAFADRLLVTTVENDVLDIVNVDSGTFTQTQLTGAPLPDGSTGASDFAADYGYLWGVAQNGEFMIRIDPATGERDQFAVPGGMFPFTGAYGAAWTYGNGNLAFSSNSAGTITQISVANPGSANPVFSEISKVPGPPSGNNDATAAPGAPVDLAVTKTATPQVAPSGTITWTIKVNNIGPGNSSGYILNDAVPAGVTNVASPNPQCTVTGTTVACAGDSLKVGKTDTLTLTGTAPNHAANLTNTANVIGNELDPDLSNNQSSAPTTVAIATTASLTLLKHAAAPVDVNGDGITDQGDTIAYTFDVTNSGQEAITNLAISDAKAGAATCAQTSLAVGVGTTCTATALYSITAADVQAGAVNNTATATGLRADNAAQVVSNPSSTSTPTTTPAPSYTVVKTPTATTTTQGGVVGYTITVTNTGNVPVAASFTDDLSKVLDDATYNNDGAGLSLSGSSLLWSGTVLVGQPVSLSYSVTVKSPDGGDHDLDNVVVPGTNGSCVVATDCETHSEVASYTVLKSVDSTSAEPGQKVTYTITVRNTGKVDYTAANPASFSDDFSQVQDDATYDGDATGGAMVSGTTITWSGGVPQGQFVAITYSFTVKNPDTGDKVLNNVVDPLNGTCASPDGCAITDPVRSYSIRKTASAATAHPGDVIIYTVTLTNTGKADYTAASPATFSDNLGLVLDDATYNGDGTSGVALNGSTLSWSGPLTVGTPVVITYSVTVTTPDLGDHVLTNQVIPGNPGGSCAAPADCSTTTLVQSFAFEKTANSANVAPGGVLQYTVTVTNTGQIAYPDSAPASFTDDLSQVLDDATYNGDATNGASVNGSKLTWSGPLGIGQVVTVTYSVTVNDPDLGDHLLHNAVSSTIPGEGCATPTGCVVTTPVRSFTVSKTSSATTTAIGGVVSYAITVTNTGKADYTTDAPASFSDDLTDVLDDATYDNDATNGAVVDTILKSVSWTGPLPQRQAIVITYSVTVSSPDTGNHTLVNAVVAPRVTGGGCDPNAPCTTRTPIASFSVTKTSDAATAVPGQKVEYTIVVANTGQVDYTDAVPASFSDSLATVLDDATYDGDATGATTYSAPSLQWTSALPIGARTTVTYSVTVNIPDLGDHLLTNAVVTPDGTGGSCPAADPDPACSITDPVASFSVVKTANTAEVKPGDVLTYSVVVTNTGKVDYTDAAPAAFTDDLSGVLDDATYDNDASTGATYSEPTISWAGALPIGAVTTVTYSVTVTAPAEGDRVLANAVLPDTSTGGGCDTPADCQVTTDEASYSVTKTASTSRVRVGGTVKYEITVTNTGQVDYTDATPATFTDDLSQVLSHAKYNRDATNGAVVTGTTLSWSGALPIGATEKIRYSVTLKKGVTSGTLANSVVVPPESGSDCTVGSADPLCSTMTDVTPPDLAFTGSDASLLWIILAALLIAAGGVLMAVRRVFRKAGNR